MTNQTGQIAFKVLNLSLLVLFPIAWFAPLMRAAFLPLFGMSEISVMTGLQSLWGEDILLALLVTILAVFAPYLKTIGLALYQFGLLDGKVKPALQFLARLAMADIFLLSLYIVVIKGIGVGRIETAWGLYLFTFCVLASIGLSIAPKRGPQ